ncbi:MAG: hypothetical protein JWO15_3614 [Sphingomonadales bacterium]|nr:hypothetical protein [Sphingomonadales bacterium]
MSFRLDEDELQELCRNSKDRAERLKHIKTYRQGLLEDFSRDMLNPKLSLAELLDKYEVKL